MAGDMEVTWRWRGGISLKVEPMGVADGVEWSERGSKGARGDC